MSKTFKCPRCGKTAFYYGKGKAGCLLCGWLLYTEIPKEIKENKDETLANTDGLTAET